MTLLLGLDIGTTNVKAVATDLDGTILAEHSRSVEIFHLPNSAVRQKMPDIIVASLDVLRETVTRVDASRVKAIGISSQGGAMQLLEPDHSPKGDVISWLDMTGGAEDQAFTTRKGHDWLASRIGRGRSGLAIGQILRLQNESPEFLQPPQRVGFVGDVVTHFLCGRSATDATSLGLTLLYNPYKKDYDSDLLTELKIDKSQLPELLVPQQPAGTLLPEVARQIGLSGDVLVSVPVHDQYAAALGTGAVHSGDVMFGAGTAWVLLAVSDRLVATATDDAFLCTHLVPHLYGQIVSLSNGGSSFQWAVNLLGLQSLIPDEIDRMILDVPAGCDGLHFWPLLSSFDVAGLQPGTRGRLMGLQLYHTQAHVMRAVVEGLACELFRYLRFLHNSGITMKRLIMCGKAGASVITPQILADVTDLPVMCASYSGASALGAAVLAAGILEPGESLQRIAERMAAPVREVLPGANREIYRRLRQEYLASLPWHSEWRT
ncbi:MAG: FGGY family carbohydrate kinase [Planctomycetaceae bacterium]|nr:FGGY family carbohydrate kinase [Planctomycetaceae bacterium]